MHPLILVPEMQPICHNPGIFGFVKAHRHKSGASIVLSVYEEDDHDVAAVFWTKHLHYNARPYGVHTLPVVNSRGIHAAERLYEIEREYGPPEIAIRDFQRLRVYEWEQTVIFPLFGPMTWIGCERFLNRVWQLVGTGKPLKLINSRGFIDAVSLGGIIHLPLTSPFFHRKPVILHEVAHELTPNGQHGPKFVQTYIELCDRFLNLGSRFLQRTAVESGVLVG